MKTTLMQWLGYVALDARIPDYGFRVALRLASKVRNDAMITQAQKCQSAGDAAAIAALIAAGFLSEVEGPSRRVRFFKIVTFRQAVQA